MVTSHTVEDLMTTAVVALREDDPVSRVAREMRRAGVHHIPIVDGAQHVVGIVSSRDLPTARPGERAGDLMTRGVLTVRPWEALGEARRIFRENGVHAVPVVGDREQLVGIVTAHDLAGGRRAA